MTKLLVTGSGDHLATGGGVPLTTDASTIGIKAAAMAVAFGLAATASGIASAAVEPMPVTVSLSARASTKGGVEPMPIVFGMAARMSAVASLSAEPAPVTLDLSARPSGSASAAIAPMPVAFDLTAKASAASVSALRAVPMPVTLDLSAKATRAAILRAAPMSVAVDMAPAKVSVNNGPKFRQFWLDAYAGRQALLNAIDANNRNLAKEAGDAAAANATAIVQTKTRVEEAEGRIEAESTRTTLLTTDVRNAEDAILAQGSALNSLSTRTTATENGLASQGLALTAVQNELPNKASTAALNLLDTYVRQDVAGQITANSNAITTVQGQIADKAEASVVSAMSVNLNSLTNSYNASWTMALNVNGKVAGLRSENDGTTSVIDFMFDSFRVTGGAGSGWETTDGISRWYRSARQVIVGPGFGPNNLSFYIGPNVGIASASKANADIWFDDSGGYIRSGLITGAMVNARQSTQLGPTAAVSTGDFASLGGQRIVNASLSYNTSYAILGNSPVSGTWTGTIQVRRGSTNVASVPFTITASSSYDAETNSTIVNIAGGGSLTYTDNTGGTTIEYNALIVGASGDWSALGSDQKWQSLAVSSLEQ